jgi:hypothetical protein
MIANYLQNRSPVKAPSEQITPYQSWSGLNQICQD